MAPEIKDRRRHYRCTKDVGMHCTSLRGDTTRIVTIRNYSARGIYFESHDKVQPGTIVVLRTLDAKDLSENNAVASTAPPFSIDRSDPEACTRFRSHLLARVQRCVRLNGNENIVHFGMGAEIQMLTD